jgi:rubrerythrin
MLLVQTMPLSSPDEVRQALQFAIKLEHATIPPYLTALYSLQDGKNTAIASIISNIVFEEMQHMAIAANILNAIEGAPLIDSPDFVPKYPGGLPFHIGDRAGNQFEVGLKHFSLSLVRDVFMHIEEPDQPLDIPVRSALAAALETTYQTIGDFYRALSAALKAEWFKGDPARQLSGIVPKIASLADAQSAIAHIVAQGEGSTTSPMDGKEIAHYYRFEEIAKQLTLRPDSSVPVGYSFGPPAIAFDPSGVWPTLDNPHSASYPPGSPAHLRSDLFNRSYSDLLEALHDTFNGAPDRLGDAIGLMNDLKVQAIALMQIPLGNGTNAAPCFEYVM